MTINMEEPFNEPTAPAPARWTPAVKTVVSVGIALHLAAVFIAPMSFAVRPGSPAIDPLRDAFRPYIQAMFLDHGYAFFAPDPGPSHLVEYQLTFADRRGPATGRFPDVQKHVPRLLYHRHFMLSESLQTYYVPATAPSGVAPDSEAYRSWRRARDHYNALRDSYANHLARAHQAENARVHRLRHDFLPPAQFTRDRDLEGPTTLDDERTYSDLDAVNRPAPAASEFLPGISPLPQGAR